MCSSVALAAALPFVGFGFLDNFIMVRLLPVIVKDLDMFLMLICLTDGTKLRVLKIV